MNDYVEITELVSMTKAAGATVTASTIQRTIKAQQRRGRRGYAPMMDAVKVGNKQHAVWLVTRDSAEVWIAWKVGRRIRPYKNKAREKGKSQ